MNVTTIQMDRDVKNKLDEIKVHHRETYNEVIERLIEYFKKNKK